MKLTDRILVDHLQRKLQICLSKQIGLSGKLESPLFFCGGQPEEGYAYVMESPEALPEGVHIPKECLLVFAVGKQNLGSQEGMDTNGEAMHLPDGCASIVVQASREEAMNELVRIFRLYTNFQEQIQDQILSFHGPTDLLQISAPVFNNPLILYADDMSIAAQASWNAEEFNANWLGLRTRAQQMDMNNALLQDAQFRSDRQRTDCFEGPEYLLGYPARMLNLPVSLGKSYCLEVSQVCAELSDADNDRLEILGGAMQQALMRMDEDTVPGSETMHKLFLRILKDRTLDYVEASRALSERGWAKEHHYLCLVYQLTYLDRKMLPIGAICNFMERQFHGCVSFAFGEEIVNFFDLELNEYGRDYIENELKPFIRDSYLKAGYSRCVAGHMNLRRMYVQASLALDVGSRKAPYRWIHHFDEIAFTYITEQITRKLPADMICHEGVLRLREYDKEHGTEYENTLRIWLDNAQNAVHASQELFIHRSTFLYRLDKIREIMDCELDDPEELLYISMSLRLG